MAHQRNLFCQKEGYLTHDQVKELSEVTFLNGREIKNIELLWLYVREKVKDDDQAFLEKNKRHPEGAEKSEQFIEKKRAGRKADWKKGETAMRIIPVLTTTNLQAHLPEFKQNMFMKRLVRIFSEIGSQCLTLMEMIDLYSSLNQKAPMKWKTWICYCMFDYDEDGLLDQADLYRSIAQMLHETTHTPPGTLDAANTIQKAFRGHLERKKTHGTGGLGGIKSMMGIREKKEKAVGMLHEHMEGPIEKFSKRILSLSSSIRKDVIDYRYFEKEMKGYSGFRNNFSVNPSSASKLRKVAAELQKRLALEERRRAHHQQAATAMMQQSPQRPSTKIVNPMLSVDVDGEDATRGLSLEVDVGSAEDEEHSASKIFRVNAGDDLDNDMSQEQLKTLLNTWLRCACLRTEGRLRTDDERVGSPTVNAYPKVATAKDVAQYVAEMVTGEPPAVSKDVFRDWYNALPTEWRLRVGRKQDLDKVWVDMAGGSAKLEEWEARVLLEQMGWLEKRGVWQDKAKKPIEEVATEVSRMKHFEYWWKKYNGNANQTISREEFTVFWVKQDDDVREAAEKMDWDAAKASLSKQMQLDAQSPGVTSPGGGSEMSRVQRQMLKLDTEIGDVDHALHGEGQNRHLQKMFADNYDSVTESAKLEQTQAAFGIHGAVRPPMLRTRLKRFKHVKRLLEGDKGKKGSQKKAASYSETRTIETAAGLETVQDMLGDYAGTNGSRAQDLKVYVLRHLGSIHVGLWQKSLHELESHFGHGVAELMKIMKFMLTLNMGLGVLWIFIVIIPREYGVDETPDTVLVILTKVAKSLVYSSGDVERSLFYDGYSKDRVRFFGVLPLRLDVLYFMAIILNVAYSLFIILRTLGVRLTDLAQGGANGASVGDNNFERDAARDFASLLGAYNMTCKTDETAKAMRQEIRKQMETWVVATEEKNQIMETHKDCFKRTCHWIRLKTGFVLTIAMLCGYAFALYQILDKQEEISEKFSGLVPSLILSVLNVTAPLSIKYIIRLEGHFRSIEVLQATMTRIFVLKLVQLTSIMGGLLRLYNKRREEADAAEGLTMSTDISTNALNQTDVNVDLQTSGNHYCVERQFGYLFFRLVLTDALVFSLMQYGKLYLTLHGLPRFWKWSSTVNHWERGDDDVDETVKKDGYRLQRRVEKRQVGLTMEDVMNGREVKIRTVVTWWKLMPHRGESWQEFSTEYKQRPVRDYVGTLHFEKYTETLKTSEEEFKKHCETFVGFLEALEIPHRAQIKVMKDLHESNMTARELVDAVDDHWSLQMKTRWKTNVKAVKALKIPSKVMLAIATEMVQNEGLWVEVTDGVNEARLKKFAPEKFKNFVSASIMIDVLYRQTFVWIGAVFCPWLPMVACIAQVFMFLSLKHAMLRGAYKRPDEPWSAEQTFKLFMVMALLTLLITMVPTLIWLNTTPICGPHAYREEDLIYQDADGKVFTREKYMVFETFGSFIADEYFFPVESIIKTGYAVQVISILVNPPCLIIIILVMYARYTFVKTELKATTTELVKLHFKSRKENDFLTGQLEDCTRKHEGAGGVARMQRQLDRTMRAMDQKELDDLMDAVGDGADASALSILDQDGDGKTSSAEMQSFVEFAAMIDQDGDHAVDERETELWRNMVVTNTVWIGNIDGLMATEKHVRSVCHNRFGEVIACTVKKYTEAQEEELDNSPTYCPELLKRYSRRSWAIVTFVQAADVKHAGASEQGSWEGDWDAELWLTVKAWNASDMQGDMGSLKSGQVGASDAIGLHNHNLHNALDAALNLKKQVEQVRMGLFADDDFDDDLDDLDDDSKQEEEEAEAAEVAKARKEAKERKQAARHAKEAKQAAKAMI